MFITAKATKNINRLYFIKHKKYFSFNSLSVPQYIESWFFYLITWIFLQLPHFFSFCTLKKVKRIYPHVLMTLPIFIALARLAWSRVLWPFNKLMVGSLLIFAKNLFSFLSSVLTLALLCPVFTLRRAQTFCLNPDLSTIILQLPSSQPEWAWLPPLLKLRGRR